MCAPSPIPIWSPFAHYREQREVHKAYNYRLNPAAGGTAPAESPRRAFARRGLCVR